MKSYEGLISREEAIEIASKLVVKKYKLSESELRIYISACLDYVKALTELSTHDSTANK